MSHLHAYDSDLQVYQLANSFNIMKQLQMLVFLQWMHFEHKSLISAHNKNTVSLIEEVMVICNLLWCLMFS